MTAAAAASHDRDVDSTSDRELLDRARAGDGDAFGELVRRYQMPVYRAALAALGTSAEAEDAAQDAFVSAYRRLGTFRGESSVKTWLVAIAWRKALTRRRRLQFFRIRAAAPVGDEELSPLDLAVAGGAGPQLEALGADLRRKVRGLIRSLPARLRDPLLLVAGGDHTYEEAAAVLGIPVGTAKWRVSEARRVLREKLRQLGYGR